MQILFSQKNMLLCDIQDNKNGLLVKTIKKKLPIFVEPGVFSLFTSIKLTVPAVCVWMKINRVRLQHDKEFIMFRFYFPLFMVLLCVIFKSVRYLGTAFWVLLHTMFMYDWKQAAQRIKLPERLLTITKINIILWNVYRDNKFHSQRQIFILRCLWQLWVR